MRLPPPVRALVSAALGAAATDRPEMAAVREMAEHLPESVLVLTPDGDVVYLNHVARRWLGHPEAPAGPIWTAEARRILVREAMPFAATGTRWAGAVELVDLAGRTLTGDFALLAHRDRAGRAWAFSAFFAVAPEDRGIRSAGGGAHNVLTGLPNRLVVLEWAAGALARSAGRGRVAALAISIDRIRRVTQNLGVAATDELLLQVRDRVAMAIRDADRLGHVETDTFAVLCEEIDPEDAAGVAGRVLDQIQRVYDVLGRRVTITASVGYATGHGGRSAQQLVSDADVAREEAHRRGGGRIERCDEALRARATERFEVEHALRAAISGDQLEVFYQPEVNLRTGEIEGFEALVRWHHPERGLILPGDFIPVAEETGMIVEVGGWVLDQALRQSLAWAAMAPWPAPPFVAVNVSALQLSRPEIVAEFAELLATLAADPARIQLEITESVLVEQPELVMERIAALRALGFGIAIDDFGSGYSSLGYLKNFAVDVLKIDRGLIANIAADHRDWAIVNGILGMSHAMGLRVVGEGVEQGEQAGALRILGCDLAQGWHFAPAAPAPACEELLRGGPSWKLALAEA